MNSTGWREQLMMHPLAPDEIHPGREPVPRTADDEVLRLSILAELEASLRASQQAILTRGLEQLDRLTHEQCSLQQRLSLLPKQATADSDGLDPSSWASDPGIAHSLSPALVAAHRRVLHLGRVQSALLHRAQQSLRTLACWMAGPAAGYRPLPGNRSVELHPNSLPNLTAEKEF